ncbi:hypothetical protein KAS08_02360 [Candidatus Pacearchaeota archaeon]|nr:hypothetical protein [Candidatus Pacearchaeota archaeon]
MGNNTLKLRFVEHFAIFTITGFLLYEFLMNMQITLFSYNIFGELMLITIWYLAWMGTMSLIKKLLKRSLQEVKMGDEYIERRREAIKSSKTDEEIDNVLNGTYNDGFEDGND